MNLKELSKALGLSQTTVSRALNGYPEVGKKTRTRVLKMAEELNYRPNRFAKSLATGRSGHVGIVFPVERNLLVTPLFNEFLVGVTQLLLEKDMDLTIIPVAAEQELSTYHQLAKSGRVDGLIISTPLRQDRRIETLLTMDLPFVVHGRLHPHETEPVKTHMPFSYVDVDNVSAFEKATQLLLDMGHEHIVLINDDTRFTFAYHRQLGYKKALHSQHRAFQADYIYPVDMTEEQGYQAAKQALTLTPKVSAFLVSSVIIALGVKRAVREIGLRPGEDIALITYDDELPYLQSSKFNPPLTAVTSSISKAGYQVAKQLHTLIDSPGITQPLQQVLDVDLIVRGSTRACS